MSDGFIYKKSFPSKSNYRYIKEIITENTMWEVPNLDRLKDGKIYLTLVGGGAAGTASYGGGGGYVVSHILNNKNCILNSSQLENINTVNIIIGKGGIYDNNIITNSNKISRFGNYITALGGNNTTNAMTNGGGSYGENFNFNNTIIAGGLGGNYISSSLEVYRTLGSMSSGGVVDRDSMNGGGGGASYGPGGDVGQDGINGSGGGSYGNGGNGLCIIEYYIMTE